MKGKMEVKIVSNALQTAPVKNPVDTFPESSSNSPT